MENLLGVNLQDPQVSGREDRVSGWDQTTPGLRIGEEALTDSDIHENAYLFQLYEKARTVEDSVGTVLGLVTVKIVATGIADKVRTEHDFANLLGGVWDLLLDSVDQISEDLETVTEPSTVVNNGLGEDNPVSVS